MRHIIIFLIILFPTTSYSQNKLTPATVSEITGIPLPAGTKLDKRILYTAAAKELMNMSANKKGVTVSPPEVYMLPGLTETRFSKDSLTKGLDNAGWKVSGVDGEPEVLWIEKGGRNALVYYKEGKKQTELYIADTQKKPAPLPAAQAPNNLTTAPVSSTAQPGKSAGDQPTQTTVTGTNINTGGKATGYQFIETNFDDGWTAKEETDWVRVTKGDITVLLHYNHYKVDYSSSDIDTRTRNAWNVIVAPRYSNLRNFYLAPYIMTYESVYFASGTLTDAAGDHYVVLFRRGRDEWIEFITPTKQIFTENFGVDQAALNSASMFTLFDGMKSMYSKNYFAVAASDLPGHWATNFFGMTQYVNTNTGLSAGATAHSSAQEYIIAKDLSYNWSLAMASGWVGAQNLQSVKSNGKLSMVNNWTIHFSDLEGKPKDLPVFFTCVKGGRMLWINGTGYAKK